VAAARGVTQIWFLWFGSHSGIFRIKGECLKLSFLSNAIRIFFAGDVPSKTVSSSSLAQIIHGGFGIPNV
jgi:hypothetical protein